IVDSDLKRVFEQEPQQALRAFAKRMIDTVFAPETLELHRIVIAESHRFPKLGALFYRSGPQACVDVLAAYFDKHRADARLKIRAPRRSAPRLTLGPSAPARRRRDSRSHRPASRRSRND